MSAVNASKVACNREWVERTMRSNVILVNLDPFPHADAFSPPVSDYLLKTLWQKEKLLMMSNFSVCHNVFIFITKIYFHFSEVSHMFCLDVYKKANYAFVVLTLSHI